MLKKLITGATLLCAVNFANAAIMETTQTIAIQSTDFEEMLNFAKFDNMGGTKVLESVLISYEATLDGSASFENTGPNSTTIGVNLVADFFLTGPSGLNLASSVNEEAASVYLTGYDGVFDFAGSSGFSDSYVTTSSNSQMFISALDVGFFNGPGMFDVTFGADAASFATGAGNAISQFLTTAGADVTVTYRYTMPELQVSAPASLAILGLGLIGLARLRRA